VSRIHVLAPDVADAIAAGEVVERPASVVKELVENALDAGARRIAVDVQGAGRTLIRVADDGSGVEPPDLPLAFQRHATSKLAAREDLVSIGSLGFRGEALASIAAVSDVECRSRGARIRIRGGSVVEVGGAPEVPGTVIEVRDLFGSTPARLKFLRSDAAETAACVQALGSYALLYPEVRFVVTIGERRQFATPGDGDPVAAAAAVLGAAVARELVAVSGDAVNGLVSQPRLHRSSRDAILLGVNRRPVSSRSLTYALEECYSGRLERGRHPVAVLDLAVPLDEVDVNVHPAKREVRFRSEGAVFAGLQRAVRAALLESRPYEMPVGEQPRMPLAAPLTHSAPALLVTEPVAPAAVAESAPLRALGQVGDGYLVAESDEGVLLIDQHAAHERVLYNRFLARLRGARGISQPLLIPIVVELDPRQSAALADHAQELAAAGFVAGPFGPRQARVEEAPAETPAGRVAETLTEALTAFADSRGGDEALHAAAASLACHSAVRFGDQLDPTEQRRLLQELESAAESITCPHGRPTRLLLTWGDLKRHFRRNY
jgi:DNA mismatch repair protein MutL